MTSLTYHPKIDVFFESGKEDREKFINDPSISEAIDYIWSAGDHKEILFNQIGELILLCPERKVFESRLKKKVLLFRLNRENSVVFNKFLKVAGILKKIYETGQETANLRGAFLEAMVLKLLKNKFTSMGTKSAVACFVLIYTKATWKSEKTVDIGFWCKSIGGECHECKVKRVPNVDILKNLNEISSNSHGMVRVAFTTLNESSIFRDLPEPKESVENIFFYGRDNIFSIYS